MNHLRYHLRRTVALCLLIGLPLGVGVATGVLYSTSRGLPERQVELSYGSAQFRVALASSDGIAAQDAPGRLREISHEIQQLVGNSVREPLSEIVAPIDASVGLESGAELLMHGFDLNRSSEFRQRFPLDRGAFPSKDQQIAISAMAATRLGVDLGSPLQLSHDVKTVVVGIFTNPSDTTTLEAVGSIETTSGATSRWADRRGLRNTAAVGLAWYIHAQGVTQESIAQLRMGSKFVVSDALTVQGRPDAVRNSLMTILIPGLLTILIFVSVLAASSFALSASQLSRDVGLLGVLGLPRSARVHILVIQGLLVGTIAAVLACVFGISSAALLTSPVSGWFDKIWGPLTVDTLLTIGICASGVVASVLACWLSGRTRFGTEPLAAYRQSPAHLELQYSSRARNWLIGTCSLFVVSTGLLYVTRSAALIILCGFLAIIAAVSAIRALIVLIPSRTGNMSLGIRLGLRSMLLAPGRVTAQISIIASLVLVSGLVSVLFGGLTQKMVNARGSVVPPGAVSITEFNRIPADLVKDIEATLGRSDPVRISYAMDTATEGPVIADSATLNCVPKLVENRQLCHDTGIISDSFQMVGITSESALVALLQRELTPMEADIWQSGGFILLAPIGGITGYLQLNQLEDSSSRWLEVLTVDSIGTFTGSELPNLLIADDRAREVGLTASPTAVLMFLSSSGSNPTPASMAALSDIVKTEAGISAQLYIDTGAPAAKAIRYIYTGAGIGVLILSLLIVLLIISLLGSDIRPEWHLLSLIGTTKRYRRRLTAGITGVCAGLGVVIGLAALTTVASPLIALAGGGWTATPFYVTTAMSVLLVVCAAGLGWLFPPNAEHSTVRPKIR